VSVLWALGALALVYAEWRDRKSEYAQAYFECVFAPNNDAKSCQGRKETWVNEPTRYVQRVLPLALAPIPVVWLMIYLMVWITRWVRRGFEPTR
jgi:hypothetical protein